MEVGKGIGAFRLMKGKDVSMGLKVLRSTWSRSPYTCPTCVLPNLQVALSRRASGTSERKIAGMKRLPTRDAWPVELGSLRSIRVPQICHAVLAHHLHVRTALDNGRLVDVCPVGRIYSYLGCRRAVLKDTKRYLLPRQAEPQAVKLIYHSLRDRNLKRRN